jgi:Mg/Co/Ni transporter MgtE
VAPDTDLADVALLMADYNLVAIPVVDDSDLILGLITVDDVLESTIPEDWRRRQPGPHPEHPHPMRAEASQS